MLQNASEIHWTYPTLTIPFIILNQTGLHKRNSLKLLAVGRADKKYSAPIWNQANCFPVIVIQWKQHLSMSINPLMYHQLIFHCSYQLRDERKYRNILETDNWLNSVLWITLSHSPVCLQCCTHRHTCSVHNNMHRRREEEVCCASLSKAMLRLWKLHTRRCHMNSSRHQSADLWKADTTEGVVAQASSFQALHPTRPRVTSTNDTSVCSLIQLQSFHWL